MTITRVQGPYRGTASSGTTVTVTLGSNPINGNTIIITILDASGNKPTGVSGPVGVTWDASALKTDSINLSSIWRGVVTGTPSAKVITVTIAANLSDVCIVNACEYSGLLTVNPIDKSASADGNTTTGDTGTTATTTQASELFIGAIGAYHASLSVAQSANTYTMMDGADYIYASQYHRSSAMLENIVTSTGAADGKTTIVNTPTKWYGCIVTLKALIITKTISDSIDVIFAKRLVANWLTGWSYRAAHTVNAQSGAGTGYQKRIVAIYPTALFRRLRFATEIGTVPTPAGKTIISAQTAHYWDGTYMHVWFGASDDGTADKDKLYYTKAAYPFTSWSTPVVVIDLTGLGQGIRDPTSYILGSIIYLFCQVYTTSDSKTHPIKLYKTTTTSDFTSSGSYTYVGAPVDLGSAGQFDDTMVASPCIMKSGTTYYMMYEAEKNDGKYSIGRAKTTNIESCPWTKDDQLKDSGGSAIVNPFANTEGIVPDVFSSSTELYVHCQRPSGGKCSIRGITGNFVSNSVALDTYDMEPQNPASGDNYYNHNNVNELGKYNNIVYYLMQSWDNPPSILRVYACIDCVECNAHCEVDFDDIRFTSSDGKTLLSYWLEQKVDSDYGWFWVNIPDSISSNPYDMYVYYGGTDSSLSDIKTTSYLAQGDDFDDESIDTTNRWATGTYKTDGAGNPTVTEQNDRLEIAGVKSGDEAWLVSKNSLDLSACIVRVYSDDSQVARLGEMGFWIIPTKYTNVDLYAQSEWYRILNYADGNCYIQSKAGGTLYSAARFNAISIFVVKIVGGKIYFYEQDKDHPWLVYLRYSESYALSSTTAYIYLEGRQDDGTHVGPSWYDNEFMRKIVATEPTNGKWGDEEIPHSTSIDVLFKKLRITTTDYIDVLLKKLKISKTDKIDVLFKKLGIPSTYSIDVIFKTGMETKIVTYDIDVLYKKLGLTTTDSVDALFKKLSITTTDLIDTLFKKLNIVQTEQIDVILKKLAIPTTYSIDVRMASKLTSVDSIDVLYKKLGITTVYPIDVRVASRLVSTDLIDVLFKELGLTKTDKIDVLFKKLGIPITDSIDVLFKKLGVIKTDSIDVLFKQLGITKTDSIDVLFKKLEITTTYPIDVRFASRLTSTDLIDVLFKELGILKTDSVDVLFKKLGIVTTADIDTLFKKLNITATDSVDVLFEKLAITIATSVDVLFKKLGVTVTDLIDVRVASRLMSPYTIDTLFKKLELTKTDSIDVLLEKLGIIESVEIDVLFKELGVTQETRIDVLFKKLEIMKTDSVDVLFKKLGIVQSVQVDVLFKKLGIVKAYLADLIMKKLDITVPYYLDALFKKNEIANGYLLDAIFSQTMTPTLDYQVDTLIKRLGISKETSIDTILKKLAVPIGYDIDTLFKKQGIPLQIIIDAILKKEKILASYKTDVLEKKLGITKPYSVDALLATLRLGKYDIDSVLKKNNIPASYVIDVILNAVLSVSYSMDVVFIKGGVPSISYLIDVVLQAAIVLRSGGGYSEIIEPVSKVRIEYIDLNYHFKVKTLRAVVRAKKVVETKGLVTRSDLKRAESKKVVELDVARKVSLSNHTAELEIVEESPFQISTSPLKIRRNISKDLNVNSCIVIKSSSKGISIVSLDIVNSKGKAVVISELNLFSETSHSVLVNPLETKKKKKNPKIKELADMLNDVDKMDE